MVDDPADASAVAAALAVSMVRLRARLRREAAPQAGGWSWSQVLTLTRIIDEGPITVTELARAEHIRPQSMTDTVVTLRKAGLVDSKRDPDDGRRLLIGATKQGREIAAQLAKVRENWLAEAIDTVADPQQRALLAQAAELMNQIADFGIGETRGDERSRRDSA